MQTTVDEYQSWARPIACSYQFGRPRIDVHICYAHSKTNVEQRIVLVRTWRNNNINILLSRLD